MAGEGKRRNLGRGLSALLGEDTADYTALDSVRLSKMAPIELVHPGRYQPRHGMDENLLDDLAQSIREKGILQPLVVRRHPDEPNAYEIIAGERRWRAAQLAQQHEIPVIVKDLTDSEALEIALVENLQRQDLSVLEEAEGYRRLMDEFSHTQEILAKSLGKSRSHVANTLRLLGLPDSVKQLLEEGKLTAGHARALLNVPDPTALAKTVVDKGLNVRQTEKLVQTKGGQDRKRRPPAEKDPDTAALERDLVTLLGLKVEIKFKDGRGSLTIHYTSLDQLDDILHRLSHEHRPAMEASSGVPAAEGTGDPAGPVVVSLVEDDGEMPVPSEDPDGGLQPANDTGSGLAIEIGDGDIDSAEILELDDSIFAPADSPMESEAGARADDVIVSESVAEAFEAAEPSEPTEEDEPDPEPDPEADPKTD
jgi:ParB family chromosome partitioning protein